VADSLELKDRISIGILPFLVLKISKGGNKLRVVFIYVIEVIFNEYRKVYEEQH